jgi:hypothetical protein
MALSGIPVMDNYNKEKIRFLNAQSKYLEAKKKFNSNKNLHSFTKFHAAGIHFDLAANNFFTKANAAQIYLGMQPGARNPMGVISAINRHISRRLMPKTPNR